MGDIVNLIDAFSKCRHIQYECTNSAGLTSSKVRTVCVKDTICPTCDMRNAAVKTVTVEASFPYVDGGATCSDTFDGPKIVGEQYYPTPVDVEKTGTYVITYTATDESGNTCDANHPRRTVVVVDTLKPIIGLEYGGKFLHQTKADDKTAHASHHAGTAKQQDTHPHTNAVTLNPAFNYFSLMAETATSNSAFVLGAVVSAISGLALFSYAVQQRSTSAVADLV